jgi:hypothetical protein
VATRKFIACHSDNMRIRFQAHIGISAKSFFITKILCTYTMNYLHQEKSLPDHEVAGMPSAPF